MPSDDFGIAMCALWARIRRLDTHDVEGHLDAVRAFCEQVRELGLPPAVVGTVIDTQLAVLGRLDGERWRVWAAIQECHLRPL